MGRRYSPCCRSATISSAILRHRTSDVGFVAAPLDCTRLGFCQDTGPGFFEEEQGDDMPETLGITDVQRAYEMGFRDAEAAYDATLMRRIAHHSGNELRALVRYDSVRRALAWAAGYASLATVLAVWGWAR